MFFASSRCRMLDLQVSNSHSSVRLFEVGTIDFPISRLVNVREWKENRRFEFELSAFPFCIITNFELFEMRKTDFQKEKTQRCSKCLGFQNTTIQIRFFEMQCYISNYRLCDFRIFESGNIYSFDFHTSSFRIFDCSNSEFSVIDLLDLQLSNVPVYDGNNN